MMHAHFDTSLMGQFTVLTLAQDYRSSEGEQPPEGKKMDRDVLEVLP